MTLPRPFVYPTSPHARRHGPAGYEDYDSFKDWLRTNSAFVALTAFSANDGIRTDR